MCKKIKKKKKALPTYQPWKIWVGVYQTYKWLMLALSFLVPNFISILRKPENFAVTYLDVPNVFEKFWVVIDGEIKQII